MRWKGDPPDDDPVTITGDRPARTTGMYKRWLDAVGAVVRHRRGRPEIAPPVFASNMRTMRETYSIEAITAAFHRFAAAVDAGTVSVQNKPAWLVFMAMRDRFLQEVDTNKDDPFKVEQQSTVSPFRRARKVENPFRLKAESPTDPWFGR